VPDQIAGDAQADDTGNVERARSQAALVAPAVDDRFEADPGIAATYVERADALRPVHLVRGDREQIDAEALHVAFEIRQRLHGIAMEDDAALLAERADFRHGLNRADFVVGHHDGDEDGIGTHRRGDATDLNQPVGVHRNIRDLEAFAFEPGRRIEHRLVLDRGGDDVAAAGSVGACHAFQRQVVRFGRAGGEDDLRRIGADQCGHLPARLLHACFGVPAEGVLAAGGVAECSRKVGSIASTTRGSQGVVA
jgi:hypothetical protein